MSAQDININYANATPPQKNLSMLGRCYDLKFMDPMNLSGSALMYNYIKYKFGETQYLPVPDNSMTIPNGVLYKPGNGGTFSNMTQIAESYKSFIEKISGTVKFGIGVTKKIDFSGSISADYYRKEEAYEKTVVTYTKLIVHDDSLMINHSPIIDSKGRIIKNSINSPDLNPELLHHLMSIKNETMAEEFITTYGSHYTTQVDFGGIAYQWLFLEKKEYQELKKNGLNIKAEAEGILKGVSLSGGIEVETKLEKEFREATQSEKQFINFIGGLPNDNLYTWASSVPADPAAISVVLQPIGDTLEDRNCIQRKSIESVLRVRSTLN